METKLTEQESLSLIGEMIKQARNNFQKGSGNGMIFAGWLVAIMAILNVILAFVFAKSGINGSQACWVWCIMIPGSYIIYLIGKKMDRESIVKTHINHISDSIWNGYLISVLVFLIVIFSIGFAKNFYHVFFLINPVILVLLGLAEFATAKAYRFKPYLYGAFIMWIGALACTAAVCFWNNPVIIQFFILALCMILGFVIPGYQLNKKAKENV
jgi:hypothetical protein